LPLAHSKWLTTSGSRGSLGAARETVISLIRESVLNPEQYVDRFVDTVGERIQKFASRE